MKPLQIVGIIALSLIVVSLIVTAVMVNQPKTKTAGSDISSGGNLLNTLLGLFGKDKKGDNGETTTTTTDPDTGDKS